MESDIAVSSRQLKRQIYALLEAEDLHVGLAAISKMAPRRAVNPLFSLLLDRDELIRWRAVTAMGQVVAALAEREMESARVVLRRMLWMLNDESGGIGWGIPEAMGEIMALSQSLAVEYACMLVSYCREDGNYLEHPILQRGVAWGVGRLAHARPDLLSGGGDLLRPWLAADDPVLRGTAAWGAGAFTGANLTHILESLSHDPARLRIYQDLQLRDCTVGALVLEALAIRQDSVEPDCGDPSGHSE